MIIFFRAKVNFWWIWICTLLSAILMAIKIWDPIYPMVYNVVSRRDVISNKHTCLIKLILFQILYCFDQMPMFHFMHTSRYNFEIILCTSGRIIVLVEIMGFRFITHPFYLWHFYSVWLVYTERWINKIMILFWPIPIHDTSNNFSQNRDSVYMKNIHLCSGIVAL